MNKVEKMKIENHVANLEEEINTVFDDITSVEFYVKQIKRYVKESVVEQEPTVDMLGEIREKISLLVNDWDDYDQADGYYTGISDALSVIDKYRKEG